MQLYLQAVLNPTQDSQPTAAAEEGDEQQSAVEEQPVEQVVLRQNGTNFPAIWSEEGKYLASVLGDALVKGLSLVSQERPLDPVEYLSNFLRKYKDGDDPDGEYQKELEAAAAAAVVAGAVAAGKMAGEGEETKENEEEKQETEKTEAEAVEEPPSEEAPKQEEKEETAAEEEPMPETEPEKEPEPAEVDVVEESTEPPAPVEAEEVNDEACGPPEEASEDLDKIEADPPAEADPPKEQPTASVNPEESLETELTEGYDKLEDALEEEEASASPFDPMKEEQAEKALLESSAPGEPGEDGDVNPFSGHNSTRDENGQSVLHFACTRPGGGSTISAFLSNPSVNLAWRDVNLRTARDVASNLGRVENVRVVDSYVVTLAQRGDFETLEGLLIEGYDHLADIEDLSGCHIVEVADNADHKNCAQLLRSAPEFRERIERVHRCVRSGDIDGVKSLVGQDKRVGFAINPKTGRNALHVAVLCEEIAIVKWLAENCVEAVKKPDNLERTCLHLSMGVDKCEKIVRILVRAGAKRVVKDLRDRQPSYFFMHKDEIGELQAEERAIVN